MTSQAQSYGPLDRGSRFAAAAEKVKRHADWFNRLFDEYFIRLLNTQERPTKFEYPQWCLDSLRELALAGGKRQRVAFFTEAARLLDGMTPAGADEVALSI